MRLLCCMLLISFLPGLLCAEVEQKPEPQAKALELRLQVKKLEREGKIDEAIEACAKLFEEPDSAVSLVTQAEDMETWMRLLWKRNKPQADNDLGDRKTALKAGQNFLQTQTRKFAAEFGDEKHASWERVKELTSKYELELDWEKKFAGYLGVFEKTDDPEEKGETLMLMIELLMENKEYRRALEQCRVFLDKGRGITRTKWNRAYAMYYKGLCHEELNQSDDAIVSYALAWTTHMGMIEVSAPAMERWMRMLWKRNTPGGDGVMSDRQGACEGGRQYIDLTKRFQDKMRENDHRLWKRVKDLTEAYEAQLKRREPKPAPESKGVLR